MNYDYIQNMNQRKFDATLKREGTIVYNYYNRNKQYEVFFRKDNRDAKPQRQFSHAL